MEEYLCQAFTNNVAMYEPSVRQQMSSQMMTPYSTASDDLPSDSAAAHLGVHDVAPAWVNIMYFVAFILGASFVW